MHLYLSNLVDLALGKPHYLECENFNILHTLLHVILRKTNLSDTRVELADDMAGKAENLMKMITAEPSICFKEFTLKNDGGKVRKRDSREICVKRSLTQIKKKWPKCCTSTTDSEKIPGCSHPSLVTIPEKQSQCEIDDAVASLTSKIESLVRDMSQRMDLLENGFSEFMSQANCQKIQNSATFDDFNRMKYQFTKAAQLNKLDEPLNLDFLNKMNPSNCKVKVNFSKMGGLPQETTSGDTFASDEVEDIRRDIIWLKERMAELSDSMKIQSLASKRLKREGLKKLKDQVGYLAEYFQRLKFNAIETRDGELK